MRPLEELAQFVPMRLSPQERIRLTILEQTLTVSEYTDNIDTTSRRNKAMRIVENIIEACSIATGLGIAAGFNNKEHRKRTLAEGDPSDNQEFLAALFEVGRRNKILNPNKMRDTYGKLMYLMQDSGQKNVANAMGFTLYDKIITVSAFLSDLIGETRANEMLNDELFLTAVQPIPEVNPKTGKKYDRSRIIDMAEKKKIAKKMVLLRYAISDNDNNDSSNDGKLELALDSMSDAKTVIQQNVLPVERMLALLEENFDRNDPKEFSLELNGGGGGYGRNFGNRFSFSGGGMFGGGGMDSNSGSGSGGAKLSHSHGTQFTFVRQTLNLWIEIQKNMHKLWSMADEDLLSETSSYQLSNTGQGLNRVQRCPEVGHVMNNLLHKTQKKVGEDWVGLSVIHLGDRDVPNALIFIDKYTQVPAILLPIVDFVDGLEELCSDPKLDQYVTDNFGTKENLKLSVLCDYFKHGFDGSGDDGGSCIDGRLTSSWNWTSKIAKKKYYSAFMLSGFLGFNGDFK